MKEEEQQPDRATVCGRSSEEERKNERKKESKKESCASHGTELNFN